MTVCLVGVERLLIMCLPCCHYLNLPSWGVAVSPTQTYLCINQKVKLPSLIQE